MGLLSFMKEAGEKLLRAGHPKPEAGQPASGPASGAAPQPDLRAKEQELEQAIRDYITVQHLPAESVNIAYDSASATVTVSGSVPNQQAKEKILLCCGNVQGVAHVNDELNVVQTEAAPSQWYTVQSGDTLSKIARQFYGDPNKYMLIFESNRPMLSDPDKIYPGQMLRIPDQASLH
ncbi:peptidoglycan-binding protein LysM [Noviherbaspirillum sedimenti]|uniref:Potassium binding protein Kbp n=1 Tax=Noviherbaspirillum sedimenti TaxID=2320865 RepID=A0A3A3FXA3_9BURK|nr:peptidoglycan-binding protein LysM [Noviherbaspirillum sedimenti]RJG00777.1 peptidoglycan-binding protein LysM [Noviherbaspirillum sedimenti]